MSPEEEKRLARLLCTMFAEVGAEAFATPIKWEDTPAVAHNIPPQPVKRKSRGHDSAPVAFRPRPGILAQTGLPLIEALPYP